jgi:hypothetical protein
MMCDNCSHFLICHFEVAPDECPYFLSNDLVEVVRCKDCKNYQKSYCVMCCNGQSWADDDEFCSYGERIETE